MTYNVFSGTLNPIQSVHLCTVFTAAWHVGHQPHQAVDDAEPTGSSVVSGPTFTEFQQHLHWLPVCQRMAYKPQICSVLYCIPQFCTMIYTGWTNKK